jgi:predicted Rossmann-fold nucleotide-binding protein
MGNVAQAVLDNGGHVTGISPSAMVSSSTGENMETAGVTVNKMLNRTPAQHPNRVSIVVESMHERKTEMAKRADGGFVALPGGYGTFEEVSVITERMKGFLIDTCQLLEVTTWAQLAILQKRE